MIERDKAMARFGGCSVASARVITVVTAVISATAVCLGTQTPAGPAETPEVLDVLNRVSTKGDATAQFAVLEFSDYQCPFCAKHANSVLDAILDEYVETGMVRYVFLNFPLETLHPFAPRAAELGECAGRAGRFWEMHKFLFRNQGMVRTMPLSAYRSALRLDDFTTFEECVSRGATDVQIREDIALGVRLGVRGTPGFVFGEIKMGKVYPIRTVSGAAPLAVFRRTIDDMLSGKMKP